MYSCQMSSIGSRLDEAMREARFRSQSALARKSGVPQATISRILSGNGEQGPETETMRKLAAASGVTFAWLTEGVGSKHRGLSGAEAHPMPMSLHDESGNGGNLTGMPMKIADIR